jgi:peptidoglycan/LPS O-acetylase OafA/YrhL
MHQMDKKMRVAVSPLKRILGIDQLRYVFALWVFFTHGGSPPLFNGHGDASFWETIQKCYGWCVNGQAAVMGFFIISGLCIHYPNIRRNAIDLPSFYTARLLRLALPLLCCLGIALLLNYQHPDGLQRAVPIWTLYCEAIYYCIYPLVFWISKKGKFSLFLGIFSLLSFVMLIVWADDRNMYFHEVGGKGEGGFLAWKAALLAFPCWLLGCLIGEHISDATLIEKQLSRKSNLIWWRISALLLSMVTFPLYRLGLHKGIIQFPFLGLFFSSQFTLLIFGIFCFFWIKKEVIDTNFGTVRPNEKIEWWGISSFSLYLVHTLVIWLFSKIPASYFPGYLLFWIFLFLALHLTTFVFYKLIEGPSHKISKYCAGLIRRKNGAEITVSR